MNNLPEPRNEEDRDVVLHQRSIQFSGPLPPPEILEKYDRVVPGAAERILRLAEEQSEHRKGLERKVIESDIERSRWGQILGFVIAIVGLGVSAYISVYGNPWAGGVIGVGTLASLVGVFMYGSTTRSRERSEKEEAR